MTDLTTRYLGLTLRSPLVASASPLTGDVDMLRALEAAGAGAVVLPSLFEEQLTHEALQVHEMLEMGSDSNPEAAGYLPDLQHYNTGPSRYLRLIEQARAKLEIPIIASLNGVTPGGWTRYARLLSDAGAEAIELNIYRVVADVDASPRAIEQEECELVAAVKDATSVPVAVKLGPFFTAFAHFAADLVAAGADGLVLFNRFYQPDIDLVDLAVEPRLVLSDSEELRLPLRWIAILHGRLQASLAATTGIHTATDVAKALLAGADVTMMASALLRHGPDHLSVVESELVAWMADREYDSVDQLRGSVSQLSSSDPSAFERANYMKTLTSYSSTFLV
jgi:dihydroorotate dehydrogenase (fumarate)